METLEKAGRPAVSSKRFERGLVVGKFSPLHLGHELVIRRALEDCDRVFLISFSNPEFPQCGTAARRMWLEARFPETERVVIEPWDSPGESDTEDIHRDFCARVCREHFGVTVNAVFTSESYGDGFAARMAVNFGHPVAHVAVNQARDAVPISGTALRADPHGPNRRFLPDVVYASFVKRICILGAESSGKTTLAEALAARLKTIWTPEYGRELWIERGGQLRYEDLAEIGRVQLRREDETAARADRWLVCDTSPLTTLFYSLALFGSADPELVKLAGRDYARVVLCEPEFGFVQDGTRQDPEFQERQHRWYLDELARRGVPYLRVCGNLKDRLEQVAAFLAGKS